MNNQQEKAAAAGIRVGQNLQSVAATYYAVNPFCKAYNEDFGEVEVAGSAQACVSHAGQAKHFGLHLLHSRYSLNKAARCGAVAVWYTSRLSSPPNTLALCGMRSPAANCQPSTQGLTAPCSSSSSKHHQQQLTRRAGQYLAAQWM
jgi:hypothetical protein